MSGGAVTIVVHATTEDIVQVAAWSEGVAAEMGIGMKTLFAIQLCCEEAMANVMRHGFDDEAEAAWHEVRVSLSRDADCVRLVIEDEGRAFDPLEVAAPEAAATIEEAVVGGQGIHLMRRFAQDIAYERRGGTNRLSFRFNLG